MSSAGAFVYIIRWVTWGVFICCFRGFVVVVVLIIVFIPAIVEISAPPLIHQFVTLVTSCICYHSSL